MPLLTLLVGVLAAATSVIWIKLSTIDAVMLTGLRLSIATLLLTPLTLADFRRHRATLTWGHLRDSAIPGLVLALHLITWNYGVRLTTAANGSLIVNLTALATPLLLWLLASERVTRREIVGTVVAALGLGILFIDDYRMSHETLRGDAICFGSMLLLAVYLVLARRFRHHPTTLLYVTPLYGVAAITAFTLAGAFGTGGPIDWSQEWKWLAMLVLLPTILGHSLVNNAMRQLRGQVVSLVNMTQFVFATTMAWLFLQEIPSAAFYPAAALAVAGAVIAAWREVRPRREREPEVFPQLD